MHWCVLGTAIKSTDSALGASQRQIKGQVQQCTQASSDLVGGYVEA